MILRHLALVPGHKRYQSLKQRCLGKKQVERVKERSSLVMLRLRFPWTPLPTGRCALGAMVQVWYKYSLLSVLNDLFIHLAHIGHLESQFYFHSVQ